MRKKFQLSTYQGVILPVCAIFMFLLTVLCGAPARVLAASGVTPATNIRFEGMGYDYTAGSAGYYSVAITNIDNSGKEKTFYTNLNHQLKAGEPTGIMSIQLAHDFRDKGAITLYVIHSPEKLPYSYKTIEAFQNDKSCTIASRFYYVIFKTSPPQDVKTAPVTIGEDQYYRVSWAKPENADYYYWIETVDSDNHSVSMSEMDENYTDILLTDKPQKVELFAQSLHFGYFAASDSVYVTIPARDLSKTPKYTVSFETNGGSAVPSQSVYRRQTAKQPQKPTKEGYDFYGWYRDSDLKYFYDFKTPIMQATKIYAKWTKKPYYNPSPKPVTPTPTPKPEQPTPKPETPKPAPTTTPTTEPANGSASSSASAKKETVKPETTNSESKTEVVKETANNQNNNQAENTAENGDKTPKQKEKVDKKQKKTSIKKLSAGKKKLTVSWKKANKKLKGYEIQYSTDKNFKKKVQTTTVKKIGTTSKTIKKLKKGKYYVRIRTFKNGSDGKIYSKWSKAKSVKVN